MNSLEGIGKLCVPVLSCLFFVLLTTVPWPLPLIKNILVPFPLMALCFWVVNRPENFSMAWSFIIGFLQDVLLGQPLGVTALAYLAADFFLRGQRNFFLSQSFGHFWLVFTVVIAGVSLTQWVVASFLMHGWAEIMPVALRAGISIFFFPLMVSVLHQLQRAFSRRI